MPKGVYERKLLDPRIRFWSQVETGDVAECWLWRDDGGTSFEEIADAIEETYL